MGTVTGYESGKRTMEHALPIAIAMAVAFPPKWLSKFIEHVSLATQENGCLTPRSCFTGGRSTSACLPGDQLESLRRNEPLHQLQRKRLVKCAAA